MTLQFEEWPCNTTGLLFYSTSSFVHHFVTIGVLKLELQCGSAQFGSNLPIFRAVCDLEIWRMTLKIYRAPLLSNIKLYASFHHHMWIQTGVTVRKRLSWVVTSVTLTFDLWPWPFAWTLLWSLVITSENYMMIRWWEHSQKGVTDRQKDRRTDGRTDRRTDGQTENTIGRAAWSQLKTKSTTSEQSVAHICCILKLNTSESLLKPLDSWHSSAKMREKLYISRQAPCWIKMYRWQWFQLAKCS